MHQSELVNVCEITIPVYTILIILCGLGCFGNILAFIGFQRVKTKTATTFLFQCLAVADTLFLLFFASCMCSDALLQCTKQSFSQYYRCNKQGYIYLYCDPFMYMTSVWITVFLGVIRFVAVCYPLHFNNAFTLAKVKHICLIAVVIFVIFESFWLAVQRVEETKFADSGNATCIVLGSRNKIARNIYIFGFQTLIHYLIPLSSLTFITFRIIQAMRIRTTPTRRQTLNRNKQKDMKITKILVIILMIFLICNTSYLVQTALFLLNVVGDIGDKVLFFASRALLVINSGINIIVYTRFNKHYRKLMLAQLLIRIENTENRVGVIHQPDA